MADFPRGFKSCFLLGLAILSIGAECAPPAAPSGLGRETIFDVTKYGAKPDGRKENSMAFIRAWNAACKSSGPARLLVPQGDFVSAEMILQGPCTAAKPITIEIKGNLLASTDPSLFTSEGWITLDAIDGLVVTGGGTINGRGEAAWKLMGSKNEGGPLLPVSLLYKKVTNAVMHHVNFVNSKGFHSKVTDSSNVAFSFIKITAPGKSPNTDGCHISSSSNVNVTDSNIGTGDDCISVGQGTSNILIARINCGPGHGISIGSLGKRPDEKDVKGVTVINCTLTGTTNGARIKTYHASPQIQASAIFYQDIVLNDVRNPIIIDQHYNSKKTREPSKVKISDVHFRNIRGTTVSKVPVLLNCSRTFPCEGIELADINLTPSAGIGQLTSACSNAKYILRGKQNPPGPTGCA
ncbi:Exopolygalacturonase [Forsythia ovata]|uniref:Exopolygalacturonase n=1 Tax=Forsythia ovata TaxID=205694 RepID=A0ABD1VE69_9LAMI